MSLKLHFTREETNMIPNRTSYELCLDSVEQKLGQVKYALNMSRRLVGTGQLESAYSMAFALARETEHLALLTRELPAYTGNPNAAAEVEQMLMDLMPIKIGYNSQGWFSVSMPMLLPKKAKGSKEYIRSILYPAMRRFFDGQVPVCYPDCVLIFRHVYDRARPERRYRDHDNVEAKAASDAVAYFVMKDDSPLYCSHYYCTAAGDRDRTEIYVVHQSEFASWLAEEKSFPETGVALLRKYP